MRCIEIQPQDFYCCLCLWLTLTWDVLKLGCKEFSNGFSNRLTLTWDVLKFEAVAMPAAFASD